MRLSFKYRIYPTKKQQTILLQTLDTCRRVYNYFLAQRKDIWEQTGKSISSYRQMKELPQLAIKDDSLNAVYSQTLTDVARRLDKAYQAFFRRIKVGDKPGFPRFRGKGWYDSFTYPQNNGACFKLVENNTKIYLSKIGCIKIKYHRAFQGVIKTCTVKKTPTGKWFVIFSCDTVPSEQLPHSDLKVGIDAGLKTFAVLSDGAEIKRKRFFKTDEVALAKAQRKLAKQVKGSKQRRSARKVVARIHERIHNRREDFAHQESRKIVNKYGIICVEDLDIPSMLQKPTIMVNGTVMPARPTHRSIADAAWNSFHNKTAYKAENAGRLFVKSNPRGSTQDCYGCGKPVPKDLGQRIHNCPHCGLVLSRDLNAALNILRLGLQSLAIEKSA